MTTTLLQLLVKLIQKEYQHYQLELAIADLDAVNKRIGKVKKVAQQAIRKLRLKWLLEKLKVLLEENNAARSID